MARLTQRASLALLALAVACGSPLAPDVERIDSEALVVAGIDGCDFRLLIDGKSYQPSLLPAEFAVIGNRLRVQGTARTQHTPCMIGPVLTISSATLAK